MIFEELSIYCFLLIQLVISDSQLIKQIHLSMSFFFFIRKRIWHQDYTGWPKSHATEKKSNISVMVRANAPIFLPLVKACWHSISIKARLETTFFKYHYWLQQKHLTFLQIGKNMIFQKEFLFNEDFKISKNIFIVLMNNLIVKKK